jgi:hypothetical protein
MHAHCPVCGQPTEIEVGFYYGTGYVSYAITVGFSVITFIAWWVIFGFSTDDNRFFHLACHKLSITSTMSTTVHASLPITLAELVCEL